MLSKDMQEHVKGMQHCFYYHNIYHIPLHVHKQDIVVLGRMLRRMLRNAKNIKLHP